MLHAILGTVRLVVEAESYENLITSELIYLVTHGYNCTSY